MNTPRKRRRGYDYEEEYLDDEMQVDKGKKDLLKTVNDLTISELEEAKMIAAEKLRRVLFVDIDVYSEIENSKFSYEAESSFLCGHGNNSKDIIFPSYPMRDNTQLMDIENNCINFVAEASTRSQEHQKKQQNKIQENHQPQQNRLTRSSHNLNTVYASTDQNSFSTSSLFPINKNVEFTFTIKSKIKNTIFGENFSEVGRPKSQKEINKNVPQELSHLKIYVKAFDNLLIPKEIYYLTNFLLKYGLGKLQGLFEEKGDYEKKKKMAEKIREIGANLVVELLNESDCIELSWILLEILDNCKYPVIPEHLHIIFKGILALNNSSKSKRIPSASVLEPTLNIIKLLRDTMLLFPLKNRQLLQWLVGFLCRLSSTSVAKGFSAAAKQLAQVWGPLLTKKSCSTSTDWSTSLIELLIHAHGLCEAVETDSVLWKINSTFEAEINERLSAIKTPRRTTNHFNMSSPRKTRARSGVGSSLKKKIFINSPKKTPQKSSSRLSKNENMETEVNHELQVSVNSSPNYVLRANSPHIQNKSITRENGSKRLRTNY
ncbi:hypothetical protein HK099_001683 [Clydaea vesicula]|uniref:Rho-GAP domain-containing protein n=1 Tax=Clydaea vesicula TaxID=447962 RepID=A0AAD5U7S0_9FUNG|nr:hypothetical protein HK099_001683 [Clydaea vesicula]KAJ3383935.1 hypothetical protein HDU92_003879 [Lobulomyces angularis]